MKPEYEAKPSGRTNANIQIDHDNSSTVKMRWLGDPNLPPAATVFLTDVLHPARRSALSEALSRGG